MAAMRSFIPVDADSDFPIQNLPFGAFRDGDATRLAVRIGEHVVDLHALAAAGVFGRDDITHAFSQSTLNAFMGLGRDAWRNARETLT